MTERAPVPCAGCTTCCQNEALVLHPEDGDDPSQYLTQAIVHPFKGTVVLALQQKENGDCVYLGIGGCTIWDRAPLNCREFDCRLFVAKFGGRPGQRRAMKAGILSRGIVDAAAAAKRRSETR